MLISARAQRLHQGANTRSRLSLRICHNDNHIICLQIVNICFAFVVIETDQLISGMKWIVSFFAHGNRASGRRVKPHIFFPAFLILRLYTMPDT